VSRIYRDFVAQFPGDEFGYCLSGDSYAAQRVVFSKGRVQARERRVGLMLRTTVGHWGVLQLNTPEFTKLRGVF
jgi:hypothetical protein